MKRLAIALLAVTGLSVGASQIASAADLPVKAPPVFAAPAPWSWTGFYVGGHIGTGWGDVTAGGSNTSFADAPLLDARAVYTENLNPDVVVMKSAKDRG